MKKLSFVAALAIAAVSFASCGNQAPKASLKSDVDTLSYAIGMAQSQGFVQYMSQMGIDSTLMSEVIKGINDGANAGDDKKRAAYFAGLQVGQQFANQAVPGINRQVFGEDSTQSISLKNLLSGFISGITGKGGSMTVMEAQATAEKKIEAIKAKAAEAKYGDNKKKGENFLAENAKKEGVKTLPGGVQYKVIKEGNGPMPKDTSLVKVHYEGKTLDGKVFDSTYKRGEPVTMRVNGSIPGWQEAITNMPEGSVWEVYIPQEKAYGANPRPGSGIDPLSALIFKIELIESNSKMKGPQRPMRPMPKK